MKKFAAAVLTISLLAGVTAGSAFAETNENELSQETVDLDAGSVTIYDFGDIKLHSYYFGDALGDECYLVESEEGLVMIETGAFTENLLAWNEYIEGLNKPVEGALLAYHPNGIENFGDVEVYTTENALENWGEGGSIRALTDNFINTFGEGVAAEHPSEATIVEFGDTVTIAGVDFVIRDEGDDAYGIEIPAINCIYIHMLGSAEHNILTSPEHIAAFKAELESFDYDLVLTSHYVPEGQDAVDTKIAYLDKVAELADSCGDAEEFTAAMNEEFPDYSGVNYLEMTAGALYQ